MLTLIQRPLPVVASFDIRCPQAASSQNECLMENSARILYLLQHSPKGLLRGVRSCNWTTSVSHNHGLSTRYDKDAHGQVSDRPDRSPPDLFLPRRYFDIDPEFNNTEE